LNLSLIAITLTAVCDFTSYTILADIFHKGGVVSLSQYKTGVFKSSNPTAEVQMGLSHGWSQTAQGKILQLDLQVAKEHL